MENRFAIAILGLQHHARLLLRQRPTEVGEVLRELFARKMESLTSEPFADDGQSGTLGIGQEKAGRQMGAQDSILGQEIFILQQNKIHIPLPFEKAVQLFGKVKPAAEMPRQGAKPTKPKQAKARKRTTKRAPG